MIAAVDQVAFPRTPRAPNTSYNFRKNVRLSGPNYEDDMESSELNSTVNTFHDDSDKIVEKLPIPPQIKVIEVAGDNKDNKKSNKNLRFYNCHV